MHANHGIISFLGVCSSESLSLLLSHQSRGLFQVTFRPLHLEGRERGQAVRCKVPEKRVYNYIYLLCGLRLSATPRSIL